ncbi:Small subunit (SSU) processome component [Boothiomyces sp. JEL0838]|nr:Small subunit (SSU) processome component [Boothiomyces sp. JEL0838]
MVEKRKLEESPTKPKADPNAKLANKYLREKSSIPIKEVQDKKLKGKLRKTEKKAKEAAYKAAQAELLLTQDAGYLEQEGMERTWKFSQKELKNAVDVNTSRKMFDLKLPEFGPYALNYTRNGKYMIIGGRKGHVATFDWQEGKLGCELHLGETVKDVTWLQNETLFAVAQKKYTYIYDQSGMELHVLKDHIEANKLDFLPYHYLLVSVGNAGYLKYQDVSTGTLVAEHRTKLGKCDVLAQNPYNAVMHLGHSNGTVTLWSPSMSSPLVKILCHKGPVQALAIDNSGKYMATAGLDGQLKLWDIRTYKELNAYFTTSPASSLKFSAKGLLAVGSGSRLTIWKDSYKMKQTEPYMTHLFPGSSIQDLEFCPYEDILGCGHASGSGEPNFDTFEANPYQTVKQRQESEVHSLLDKIQPEMITLDPTFLGKVDRAPAEVIAQEAKLAWEANHPGETFVPRKRARGKSSSQRRYLRKQGNVVDQKRIDLKEKLEKQKKEREIERKKQKGEYTEPKRTALDRFN